MKRILSKFRRDEKGQALIIVLILMLLGGLIIAPLLAYMSSGIKVGKEVYEERTGELYAADAGIEDGVWNIMMSNVPEDQTWNASITVNGKNVAVTILAQKSATIDFFKTLGILSGSGGDYHKATPHSEWLVIYTPIESTTPGVYDSYRITVYYSKDNPRTVLSTGFWIQGYGGNTEVIPWDPTTDGTQLVDTDGDLTTPPVPVDTLPLIDDNQSYKGPGKYPYPSRTKDFLGNAFVWEWKHDGPTFPQSVTVGTGKDKQTITYYCRTQRFKLTPSITVPVGKSFPLNVAWVSTQQNDIQISWSGPITGIYPITAVATDPTTNKSTTVTSYVFADPVSATILTWDISLQ